MDIKVIFTEGDNSIKFYYFCILTKIAKPFLRWTVEKKQLIGGIEQSLTIEISNEPFTLIEPFCRKWGCFVLDDCKISET